MLFVNNIKIILSLSSKNVLLSPKTKSCQKESFLKKNKIKVFCIEKKQKQNTTSGVSVEAAACAFFKSLEHIVGKKHRPSWVKHWAFPLQPNTGRFCWPPPHSWLSSVLTESELSSSKEEKSQFFYNASLHAVAFIKPWSERLVTFNLKSSGSIYVSLVGFLWKISRILDWTNRQKQKKCFQCCCCCCCFSLILFP